MHVDVDLLDVLTNYNKKSKMNFLLFLQGKQYPLTEVSLVNSPTPVTRPTTRGGVYFSEKFAYKIKGVISDLTVVPLLSKTMLGPNPEFTDIQIRTSLVHKDKNVKLNLFANLTNSVQGPSHIELHMILVGLESV